MRLIDLEHLGRPQVIGASLVDDEILVDPGPTTCLDALLGGLDGVVPRVIALTHIHLDHAGATGTLTRRWPDAEVWVHERGAPHLVAPERLLKSATRLYGEDGMARLWGPFESVAQERIRVVGDASPAPGWLAAATPGHASHHLAYLHEASGDCFTGDVGGVRVGGSPVLAPTPPPDIDLEAWATSIERIEAWRPSRLLPTHFGAFDDVDGHLLELRAWIDTWAPEVRRLDQERWIAQQRAWLRERTPDVATVAAVEQAVPGDQAYAGLQRYWSRVDFAP